MRFLVLVGLLSSVLAAVASPESEAAVPATTPTRTAAATLPPYPNLQPMPEGASVGVTKKLLDSPIADLHWLGAKDRTLLVLSEKGVLYRSSDAGKTWAKQQAKLPVDGSSKARVDAIYISEADPHHVFLLGSGANNWVSSDGGSTYQLCAPRKLEKVQLHPTKSKWLIAETFSEGCSDSSGVCSKKLIVSKKFCSQWEEIADYVVQADWAPDGHGTVDTIYATMYKSKSDSQTFGYWDAGVDFVRTNNYFKSKEVLVPRGNRFLTSDGDFLFVAAVSDSNDAHVNLYINQDNATTSKFVLADIPETIQQHSYTILDSSEGSVFLHVNHEGGHSKHGHVYTSGADGVTFSLSLPFNRRNTNGKCDFESLQGLEGIFMANYLHSHAEAEYRKTEGFDEVQDTAPVHRGKNFHGAPRTVISFDKGGAWSYLAPPTHDVYGSEISCASHEEPCQLHLHGITDAYGPFYSDGNSVGLIMSTGVMGAHLKDLSYGVRTYFSRDAGLSWFEVAVGSHIYEFGDHGALIVMAKDDGPTTDLVYSWDQGISWTILKVSDTPVEIENIVIEPTATSEAFLIYGWEGENGLLIQVDFADLHERPCTGIDAPGSAGSDYELWTPNDGRLGGQCLLGRTITYTRRKRKAECFNPEEYDITAYYDHCACTALDYECDVGYYREISDAHEVGPCKPIDESAAVDLSPPSTCHNVYKITKGYRRVAGNSCLGGAEWEPVLAPCPASFLSFNALGKLMIGAMFLGVLMLASSKYNPKHDFFGTCLKNLRAAGFPDVKYSKISLFEDSDDFVCC